MSVFVLILAGGVGTRFWPKSRANYPKQLLNLSGNNALIRETLERVCHFADKESIFVSTQRQQESQLRKALCDQIPMENILVEPTMRNTAACIGLAAVHILHKFGDGVMCVFPSDHYIRDPMTFREIAKKAINIAKKMNVLVTIGIRPTFPSTGYGYIKRGKAISTDAAYWVEQFVEKPSLELACRYVSEDHYLWNSGMFVWKASVILEEFKQHLPATYKKLMEINRSLGTESETATIQRVYPTFPSISIDHGIMENTKNAVVVRGDFGWNDVGSWDALEVFYAKDEHGNVIEGTAVTIDTKGSIIFGEDRLIATVGIENVVVVETADAVLVCAKDRVQDVKKVVARIKECGLKKFI